MWKWVKNLFGKPDKYSSSDFRQLCYGLNTVGTVVVNENTALNLVACYAAVRVLAEDISSLFFPIYRRLPGGGKEIDRSHPLHSLLNVSPDDEITAMQFREYLMKSLLLHGNAYAELETARDGTILAMHRLDPRKVEPRRDRNGRLFYKLDGAQLPFENMLHIAGLGDGLVGVSPIKQAAQAISTGLMMDQFSAAWFANGSRGGGIIKYPGQLKGDAKKNLRESVEDVHGGPENFGKFIVLEEGATVEMLSVPPEDAQFLGTRTFNTQEISRLYRIPNSMLQENSRSTFSNVEQETLNYEKFSIRPWLERIEGQINFKCIRLEDRAQWFAEHVVEGLLRADIKTRFDAYNIARNGGWLNVDEIRELENRNPLPDGQGKIYLIPLNMADAATVANEHPQETPDEPEPAPEQNALEYPRASPHNAIIAARAALVDCLDRMQRREIQAVERAAKTPRQFLATLDEFYGKHRSIVERAIGPSLEAYSAMLNTEHDAGELADKVCTASQRELLDLSGTVTAVELPIAVATALSKWKVRSQEIIRSLDT